MNIPIHIYKIRDCGENRLHLVYVESWQDLEIKCYDTFKDFKGKPIEFRDNKYRVVNKYSSDLLKYSNKELCVSVNKTKNSIKHMILGYLLFIGLIK